jgi:hypothetical protein
MPTKRLPIPFALFGTGPGSELVPARRWCDSPMEILTGMRRRGISLGILSAEGAIAWFRPAEAVAVALTAMGGTLLVTLIVMIAIILGNNQICERVFRLLRWAANRPEPCALGQANGPGPAERHHHPRRLRH